MKILIGMFTLNFAESMNKLDNIVFFFMGTQTNKCVGKGEPRLIWGRDYLELIYTHNETVGSAQGASEIIITYQVCCYY